MVGRTIAHYRVLEKLGEGGMGVVYKAEDTQLRRIAALKFLPATALADEPTKVRLIREAQAAASLDHPNICNVYGLHKEGEELFLAMAFVDGASLDQKIKERPVAFAEALDIAIEIAKGLQEAHERGVVHRDIKPANLMLPRKGSLKIMDFGLAYLADRSRLTQSGTTMGTPTYMAPEQVLGKPTDRRADIWSLGVVLYEMVAGKPPFDSEHPQAISYSIVNEDPEPLTARRTGLPPGVDRVVLKALAKRPEERYQNADDLRVDLEALKARPGERTVAPAPAVKQRTSYLPWAIAAVFILATAVVLLLRPGAMPLSPPYRASLLPPAGTSFAPYDFAISPDGQRLAFIAIGEDGQESLWIRRLDSRDAQHVDNTVAASFPFWAPDSRRIGFFADGKLKTTDTTGGGIQTLAEAPFGRGGTWSTQGTIVFAPNLAGPLMKVPERGGAAEPATQTRAAGAHRWPWLLPDGSHFLYFQDWSSPRDPLPNGIYLGSLEGEEPRLISAEIFGSVAYTKGHLLYVHERSLVARPMDATRAEFSGPAVPLFSEELDQDMAFRRSGFSVSQNGPVIFQSLLDSPSELVWRSASGADLGRLRLKRASQPELSPDGQYLAISADEAGNGKHYIHSFDLKRELSRRLSEGGRELSPIWSHDGAKIAFNSLDEPGTRIYEVAADGSGKPVELLRAPHLIPNGYSPDGRYLAYMAFDNGPSELTVYDLAERKVLTRAGRGGEAQFSPDGKWIVRTEPPEIQVQRFPQFDQKVQISNGGGQQPRWSKDGKKLYYMGSDRKLREVALAYEGGKIVPAVPRVLFQTHITLPRFALFQYDVTDDGRFLINSLRPEAPLTLVTDWEGSLPK